MFDFNSGYVYTYTVLPIHKVLAVGIHVVRPTSLCSHHLRLRSFTLQLDSANTAEDIDSVLNKSEKMALINASNCSPTQSITVSPSTGASI